MRSSTMGFFFFFWMSCTMLSVFCYCEQVYLHKIVCNCQGSKLLLVDKKVILVMMN